MKLFTFCILSVLLPSSSADDACGVFGGMCSEAASLALGGDLTAANEALFYGKYCGINNKCSSGPCPPACDGIDKACKVHDSCLDRLVNDSPSNESCKCNSKFVLKLAKEVEKLGDSPTFLCDEGFYSIETPTGPKLIEAARNEASLIAAPICCFLLQPNGNLCTQYQSVKQFCDTLLSGLEMALNQPFCPA
jgi:hypothetical protein